MSAFDRRAQPSSCGVQSRIAHQREWNRVSAEAVEWRCSGPSRFDLTSNRYRVGFVLEQGGGRCETRTTPSVTGGYVHAGRRFLSVSPPGMELWACSDGIPHTRSIALAFDGEALRERLGDDVAGAFDLTPRLNFEHQRLCTLAEMLAAECRTQGPFGDIYGESLIVAMVVELARLARRGSSASGPRLAPWQLRLAMDYMEAQIGARLHLHDLARMTGLSQSHFGRAFRASTGMAPYQWYLNVRTKKAQQLLLSAKHPIAEVAVMTGFGDQAHFTRVFSRVAGASPAIWLRHHRR